jgi:hypothetical protein
MHTSLALRAGVLAIAAGLIGCGNEIASEEAARAAYLGLDTAVEKAMGLGFDGFNAASSANIPPQTTEGDHTGTMTVSGQVDQGSSANKGMRLFVMLVEYSDFTEDDDFDITYDTREDAQPALNLQLRGIPDGTLQSGSLVGTFLMTGELEGEVMLNLSFVGEIEPDGEGGTRRVEGSTQVTGTATSRYGTYQVDVTI